MFCVCVEQGSGSYSMMINSIVLKLQHIFGKYVKNEEGEKAEGRRGEGGRNGVHFGSDRRNQSTECICALQKLYFITFRN